MTTSMEKKESQSYGLMDVVFSWTIADVLNQNLYKNKVREIPMTHQSTTSYLNCFLNPLIEETRADLSSSLEIVSRAPSREIISIEISKLYKPPHNLLYDISLKPLRDLANNEKNYKPEFGDLFALTDVRPKCIDDLNKSQNPYTVALVTSMNPDYPDQMRILSSSSIVIDEKEKEDKKRKSRIGVYLTNMVTSMRIWTSLKSELGGESLNIIKIVLQCTKKIEGGLQADHESETDCSKCALDTETDDLPTSDNIISSFSLDNSQKEAILSCIRTSKCHHRNSVKLIWGPPGTGKTKTVASLLFSFFKMKYRTLTCAPTNIAVLGVTKRLMSLVNDDLMYDTYGLGDIVLFGNGDRMKINDHDDLFDVFLSNRVKILRSCFAPLTGWRSTLESMISLLQDPEEIYRLYLEKMKNKDNEEKTNENNEFGDFDNVGDLYDKDFGNSGTKKWRQLFFRSMEENKAKEKQSKDNKKSREKMGKDEEKSNEEEMIMTFEDYFVFRFKYLRGMLMFFITNMYTHMPTSTISVEQAKKMIRAFNLLKSLRALLVPSLVENDLLRDILKGIVEDRKKMKSFATLSAEKLECLEILKFLRDTIKIPYTEIKDFCLQNACLVFCTASSSAKLHTMGMRPINMVVIDEAAQLKECESTIPLQLSGIRHAILIGDEKQLPAMVQSKICEDAGFGRSLFERLVLLGHKRHLLEVQYRMHPSISLFPNKEFYGKKILDGLNVKQISYEKRYLQGRMYGSYSFINLTHGKEELDSRHSRKNIVEVALVVEIVAGLFKESIASKQRLRVGCISPYKAQVFAMQEKLEKKYSTDANSNFSVTVRSVDGFQGGEEDVIIISTVRSNASGSVGFLSNRQRANVALTRARHSLWILGNGATLVNSGSVWEDLVIDAERRGCFFNANEDKNLARATAGAMIELNQIAVLLQPDSPLFIKATWKVFFGNEFKESMARIKNSETHKDVFFLLEKISNGWRKRGKNTTLDLTGTCLELLELYKVNGSLHIAWSVDIKREDSKETQVIKVWDMLPLAKILNMTKSLNKVFSTYSVETLDRCKYRKLQGSIVVPETWPVKSSCARETFKDDADYIRFLENKLASLTLDSKGDVNFTQRSAKEAARELEKAQKLANCLSHCAELLKQKTPTAASSALESISAIFLTSSYSEKLLELKGEALLILQRYKEVIQLCENNSVNINARNSKNSKTMVWRWRLISKSYFYLGRLELALEYLEKQETLSSCDDDINEPPINFAATVRDLLRHKSDGNRAFESGKHREAVEHYSAAVSRSIESRPFAAVCFCNRAAAQQALGQLCDAISDCTIAIALDGSYSKAVSRRATLHEKIRDYASATTDLERLISILKKQSQEINDSSGNEVEEDLRQAYSRLPSIEKKAKKRVFLDHYLILGVKSTDEASELKKTYRRAALRHHPDKAGQFLAKGDNGDDGRLWKELCVEIEKDADRLFKMIGEAYAVLSDPSKRSEHDLQEELRKARKNNRN